MVNPCCCSLKAGTRAIAIIQIVVSIMAIIFGVAFVIMVQVNPDEWKSVPAEIIIEIYVSVVAFSFVLILGIVLLIGANKRDVRKCKIWFNVNLVLTILAIIFTIFSAFGPNGLDVKSVASILFGIYYLVVVHAFIEEIKSDPNSSHTV